MDLEAMQLFFAIGLFVILLYMIKKIMHKPVRLILKVGYGFLFGFLLVWGFNYIGTFVGIYVPVNILTIAISGFLGLPGLALIVALILLL